ncbi:MAG TPA: methylated-DNA--[protein]-cysteine S-methyltransferase [Actinomycetota bacterium]|nr:methylated-DNA--[protein]-cysteine S-methyltransferase [Actinomycetota bacterium]
MTDHRRPSTPRADILPEAPAPAPAETTVAVCRLAPPGPAVAVASDVVDSPVGPLRVAVSQRGICRLDFDALEVEAAAPRDAQLLDPIREQLDEFFEGRRKVFDLTVDLGPVHGFAYDVLVATSRIPFGELRSYGEIARAVGRPKAARAVGGALHRNPVAVIVPCHRVIGSTGSLTGFGGGLCIKYDLLELEGIEPTSLPKHRASL